MWMLLVVLGIAGLIAYLSQEKRYKWFYILYKTLPRDVTAAFRFAKLNWYLMVWERRNMTVAKIFSEVARRQAHKVAFYFEDEVWTFQRVEDYTNKIANYFSEEGYERGDRVALLLESRPEYVCLWLGLSKIGVVTALINTNLTNDPLSYSVNVADSRAIIFGSDFVKAVADISPKIQALKLYQFQERESDSGGGKGLLEGARDLRTCVKNSSAEPVGRRMDDGKLKDHLLYIYTSGTTGLPKAAVISNLRYAFMTMGLTLMTCTRPYDCVYDPLPLYHSAGGIAGVGQALLRGTTVTLRKKFSASKFWEDCNKYRCTVAQYIGEICRYLLAVHNGSPPKHSVRAMFGNGLKPQIWLKFVDTFNIKEMYEFFGSTEGNSNLINTDNTPGAVGFVPRYAGTIYPVALIRCDPVTGEPIRNERGLCIRCKPNEAGIFIGRVGRKRAFNEFAGYADRKATERKILRDVFKKGDTYFNSGDILEYDDLGYFYFKDRTGDTFRWKGENVSTSEVEAVISNVMNLNDATVYGVEIPGTEGRAGMAAIVDVQKSLDLEEFCNRLKSNLPAYAQPLFLRIMRSVPLTGTYKLIKRDLQMEGFDMDRIEDALHFYDGKSGRYVELTRDLYESIVTGKLRL